MTTQQKRQYPCSSSEDESEQDTLYPHKLHILYQSLEFPRRYTSDLTKQLNKCLENSCSLQTRDPMLQACEYERNSNQYHLAVQDLLNTYINHINIKPDVIVLGEYTPCNSMPLNVVDYQAEFYVGNGARGMTVLIKNGAKNIHRITLHDGRDSAVDHWLNGDIWFQRIKNNPGYTESRNRLKEEWKKAAKNIGECMEIMYKNRYIAMAHVKNHPSADENAGAALNTNGPINFTFMVGDLNFAVRNQNHITEQSTAWKTHIKAINTNVLPLFDNIAEDPYKKIQVNCNLKGKSVSANTVTAHDGVYKRKQPRTDLNIVGSIWPIIDKNLRGGSSKEYYVMGDHKGFLITLTTESQYEDGDETDTSQVTTAASSRRGSISSIESQDLYSD